jgi:hypothetical protein
MVMVFASVADEFSSARRLIARDAATVPIQEAFSNQTPLKRLRRVDFVLQNGLVRSLI